MGFIFCKVGVFFGGFDFKECLSLSEGHRFFFGFVFCLERVGCVEGFGLYSDLRLGGRLRSVGYGDEWCVCQSTGL